MSSHETALRELLATYEKSLNTSDATLAASCYSVDGIFMPTTLPTASGSDMKSAYEQVFTAIKLNVVFTIDELAVTSENSAYALTRSTGTQTILANGIESAEANREIFIFDRSNSEWKISRYMFNKAA